MLKLLRKKFKFNFEKMIILLYHKAVQNGTSKSFGFIDGVNNSVSNTRKNCQFSVYD
jgi:hypothetical protein